MRKKIIYLFLFILSLNAFADSVEIKIDPEIPVKGEAFKIIFDVITDNGTDPVINFSSRGIDILSKEEVGTTTQTTYINGKLSTTRKITIVYEAITEQDGIVFLDNITTNINGNKLRSPSKQISISKVPMKPKDIFVEASVPKTSVYVNESILVRYYLYSRVRVTSTDVKKFPDLPKFLKRFHQEPITPERVNIKGTPYTRRVIYTAQLFAGTPGNYTLDPIVLDVAYSSGNNSLGFGGLSFGYNQMRTTVVRSKAQVINVLPLPSLNMPKNFTGLVGKHTFKAHINKNKFMSNEPIEIELNVHGTGALELFDPPKILTDPSIEEFEVNSDLNIKNDFSADKKFSYTFLGRDTFSVKDLKIPLSYFDPETNTYETSYLEIGDIDIVPVASKAKLIIDSKVKKEETKPAGFDLSPFYSLKNTMTLSHKIILSFLFIVFLILLILKMPLVFNQRRKKKGILEVYKKGVTYKEFIELLLLVFESGNFKKEIYDSNLSKEMKKSLIGFLDKFEGFYKAKKYKEKLKIPTNILISFEKMLHEKN